ncbi:MAG: PEP-CTERM sorting domain-containing protein [Phycisphaerae bacterium]
MMRSVTIVAVLAAASVAVAAPYAGPWLQTWDFSDGTQGWTKAAGGGYWVDPVAMPSGPTLPDGGPSGAGGANLYSPDGTIWRYTLPTAYDSWVLQADLYVPNLMPLNLNPYLPGNGIQGTGVGAISTLDGKWIGAGGRGNPDGVRVKDKAWDNSNRERSWLMEEAGVAKENMWDKWVTVQLRYNWLGSGKFTAAVYTPWDSGVHDGPGWYEFAEYDIHPDSAKRFYQVLQIGAVVPDASSWTQTQIDNVKFVPEPATIAMLALGGLGLLRRRRA